MKSFLINWVYVNLAFQRNMLPNAQPIRFDRYFDGCFGPKHSQWVKIIVNGSCVFGTLITPIIVKLHIQTPHESRMCPIDFGAQGSRSKCIYYWKWFLVRKCFLFKPVIMKLHIQTLHELRMCSFDFFVKISKVKVTMHWLLKMVFGA